jgi:hypothetical protein
MRLGKSLEKFRIIIVAVQDRDRIVIPMRSYHHYLKDQ